MKVEFDKLSDIRSWKPADAIYGTRFYFKASPVPDAGYRHDTPLGFIEYEMPKVKYGEISVNTSKIDVRMSSRLRILFTTLTYEQMCHFVDECHVDGEFSAKRFIMTRDIMYKALGI